MVKSRFDDNLNHHSYILVYSHVSKIVFVIHVIQVDDCKLPF